MKNPDKIDSIVVALNERLKNNPLVVTKNGEDNRFNGPTVEKKLIVETGRIVPHEIAPKKPNQTPTPPPKYKDTTQQWTLWLEWIAFWARCEGIPLIIPHGKRSWADIFLYGNPFNIKYTDGGTDNFTSVKSLLYPFTTLTAREIYEPPQDDENCPGSMDSFATRLMNNFHNDPLKDYGLLIYNGPKNTITWTGLKGLTAWPTPNQYNLPFQICYADQGPYTPQPDLAYNMLMDPFIAGVDKRVLELQSASSKFKQIRAKNLTTAQSVV